MANAERMRLWLKSGSVMLAVAALAADAWRVRRVSSADGWAKRPSSNIGVFTSSTTSRLSDPERFDSASSRVEYLIINSLFVKFFGVASSHIQSFLRQNPECH